MIRFSKVIDRVAGKPDLSSAESSLRMALNNWMKCWLLLYPIVRIGSILAIFGMTLVQKSDAEIENPRLTVQASAIENSANGSRRVRYSVDTYLRPGDTAAWVETMIVRRKIPYAISPDTSYDKLANKLMATILN